MAGHLHLLLLDAHQVRLHAWHKGQLGSPSCFPLNAAGETQLSQWLREHPRVRVRLLVNLMEESLHLEILPSLRGRDRQAVLERRLSQHFYNTPYTLVHSLGHQQQARKEERVILAGLTQAKHIDPWVQQLSQHHAALAGIYSPAQLSGPLCQQLWPEPASRLLLSLHPQGLRQTLICDGNACFTRLTPENELSGTALRDCLMREIPKLLHYLGSQRLLPSTAPLYISPLLRAEDLSALSTLPLQAGQVLQAMTLVDAAAKLGLPWHTSEYCADPLFLHLLASQPPRQQFAPRRLLGRPRQALLQRLALASSASLCLAGLVLLGLAWANSRDQAVELAHIEARTAELAAEHSQLSTPGQEVDALSLDPASQQALLHQYAQHHQRQEQAFALLDKVAHSLEAQPELRLEKLHWLATATAYQFTLEGSLPAAPPRQLSQHIETWLQHLESQQLQPELLQHPVSLAQGKVVASELPTTARPARFVLRLNAPQAAKEASELAAPGNP